MELFLYSPGISENFPLSLKIQSRVELFGAICRQLSIYLLRALYSYRITNFGTYFYRNVYSSETLKV